MDVTVSVLISAARAVVWEDVSRLASHVEWMTDAEQIDFVGPLAQGVGTEMEARTRVGPIRTSDRMVVVAWEPPSLIAVAHRGLFVGRGEFRLEEVDATTTRFTWSEDIRFPWWLGGPLGAAVARPLLLRIWRRNLELLRARFTAR